MANILTVYNNRFKAQAIYFKYKEIHNDSEKSIKHNRILEKSIETTIKQLKLMVGITFASLIIGVANPIYVWYRDGTLYFLIGTDTPFCDKGSIAELYFNIFYTSVMTFLTVSTIFGLQLCSAIVCNTIDVTTDLTLFELDEMSELLNHSHLSKSLQMRFKRVILQILQTDKYAQCSPLESLEILQIK